MIMRILPAILCFLSLNLCLTLSLCLYSLFYMHVCCKDYMPGTSKTWMWVSETHCRQAGEWKVAWASSGASLGPQYQLLVRQVCVRMELVPATREQSVGWWLLGQSGGVLALIVGGAVSLRIWRHSTYFEPEMTATGETGVNELSTGHGLWCQLLEQVGSQCQLLEPQGRGSTYSQTCWWGLAWVRWAQALHWKLKLGDGSQPMCLLLIAWGQSVRIFPSMMFMECTYAFTCKHSAGPASQQQEQQVWDEDGVMMMVNPRDIQIWTA